MADLWKLARTPRGYLSVRLAANVVPLHGDEAIKMACEMLDKVAESPMGRLRVKQAVILHGFVEPSREQKVLHEVQRPSTRMIFNYGDGS